MPAKPRPITPPFYPIIYVRGYAATMGQIEETVGTPYMGFNLGSTKVRQRHANDKPNYKDYDAFFGMSKRGTGPTGDGLVMMKNAVVDDAPRAFAHRSHSGPFGVVNSEEGYRNLRRFLFGQVRIDARLAVDEITLPRAVQKEKDAGKQIRARYNIDACAKVRGGGSYLSERRVRNESAIRCSGRAPAACSGYRPDSC